MFSVKKILSLLALLGVCTAQSGDIRVNPKSRFMVDKFGRSTILHGVNVVYKVDPYIPSQGAWDPQLSLNDKDIDDLQKWGFNLVRLGVMWEAVERAPGVFDMTYLQKMNDLINKLGKKGIYTMVDAHQDVLGRNLCGEGMPTFYFPDDKLDHHCPGNILPWVLQLFGACKSMKDYGFRYDQNGWPLIEDCTKNMFAIYYSSPEAISAFERLYDNIDGVQDKFLQFWDKVAQVFAGNPYVVGFDPINEPFPANIMKDPTLVLIPGKFDREKLQPLYKRVFDIWQKHDAKKIMYYEAAEFPDEVGVGIGGLVFNLGFTENPGGKDKADVHVLNDHTYCCQLSIDMCKTGEPPLEKTAQCTAWHEKRLKTRTDDAKRYNVPLIISEFGACTGSDACVQEINTVVDLCDKYMASWAYWEFKKFMDITTSAGSTSEGFYENDGTLQTNKVKALARSYLKATQGIPQSMKFDSKTGDFEANFTVDATILAPTVIFKSEEYHTQNGYTFQVLDSQGNGVHQEHVKIQQSAIPHHLEVQVINDFYHGHNVTIRISGKTAEEIIQ